MKELGCHDDTKYYIKRNEGVQYLGEEQSPRHFHQYF